MLVRAVRMHNGCVCRAMCDDPSLTLTRTRTTRKRVDLGRAIRPVSISCRSR